MPNKPYDPPDMECTHWLDGVPTWLGGNGNEWIGCCQAHDTSALDFQAALDLGACVAAQGYTGMGILMAAGVAVLGPIYLYFRRKRAKS